MKTMVNHYEILGVEPNADLAQITAAWKRLLKKYHPDLNQNDPDANSRAALLNEAYQVLSNPKSRKKLDEQLEQAGQAPLGKGAVIDSSKSQYPSKFAAPSSHYLKPLAGKVAWISAGVFLGLLLILVWRNRGVSDQILGGKTPGNEGFQTSSSKSQNSSAAENPEFIDTRIGDKFDRSISNHLTEKNKVDKQQSKNDFESKSSGQPNALADQPSIVDKEIIAYNKELTRLNGLFQKAVVKARTDLDLKLSNLAKKYSDDGKTEWVKRVEADKARIQQSNPLENRMNLSNAVSGGIYEFDDRQWVYHFDHDGYIYLSPEKDSNGKRFKWAPVSESEVLFMNELGKLNIVNFSANRKKFNMKIFQPQNSKGNNRATRVN